jgi:hypothetical protein
LKFLLQAVSPETFGYPLFNLQQLFLESNVFVLRNNCAIIHRCFQHSKFGQQLQHVVAGLGFQSGICLGDFQKHAMPLEIPNVHNASLRNRPKYGSPSEQVEADI